MMNRVLVAGKMRSIMKHLQVRFAAQSDSDNDIIVETLTPPKERKTRKQSVRDQIQDANKSAMVVFLDMAVGWFSSIIND